MTTKDLPPRTAEMCSYSLAAIAYPLGGNVAAMKLEMDILLNSLGHGALKVIWGGIAPASTLAPGDASEWNAALVIVVHKLGTHDYIVVSRGTNPLSWNSWKLEDFDVCTKVPWNSGDTSKGAVSNATNTALSIHLGLSDGGKQLMQFLQGLASSDPDATFSFTGHSLGGCMAPVLALRFAELSGIKRSRLSLYAYAGPTPGDAAFAAYMTSVFVSFALVSFVRDTEDVVPHAWNVGDLDLTTSLYPIRPATNAVLKLVKYVQDCVSNNNYTHAYPGFIPILHEIELNEDIAKILDEGRLMSMSRESAALQTSAWIKKELVRIDAFTEEEVLSGFLDTLAWFLCVMCMHVLPYLALCLAGAQSILFEKVIKPYYFKGHLAMPTT